MVERLSPLEPVYRPGSHGHFEDGVGVKLFETRPGSIVQLAAWPGMEKQVIAAIRAVTGLALPDGAGGCTLAAARPNLTIIYTLPEPAQKLPAQVQRQWAAFIAGMREHEKLHGVFIKEMVEAIEAYSVGLKVADDPGCKKIRQVLTKRLGELSQAQRQRSRDFDRAEMGEAGPIRRLILALVNGA